MADPIKARMQQRAQQRSDLTLERLRQQAARMETHGDALAVDVPLGAIEVDEAIQVRVAGVDPDKVAQYAVVFDEGGEFPPVVVFRDGESDMLYLADGFHRVAAAERAGLDTIAAEVRPGGRAAAIEYAEEANLEHGFALTNRDKRYIYERRWKRGHDWRNMSDGAIARVLGVTRQTISNWRRQLEEAEGAGGKNLPPQEKIGADGKVYPVARVQDANRRRAADARKVKIAEGAMLSLLQAAGWRSVPRATLINAAVEAGVDEEQAEAILQEIVAFHKLAVTATGQVVSAGLLILDLLRKHSGEMDFVDLTIEAANLGVDGEAVNGALMELSDLGSVVITGEDEMRVMLPYVAARERQKPPSAQRVRYVDGSEFNQDVGEEAAFGVPVAETEEEAPAPARKDDKMWRAMVEMYKEWIVEALSNRAMRRQELVRLLIVDDGDTRKLEEFTAALAELTRHKQVINDGGYYRLASDAQVATVANVPPEQDADDGDEYAHPAEAIPGFREMEETLPPAPSGEKALLHNLQVLADVSAELARQLEDMRAGHITISAKNAQKVRELAEEALDYLQWHEAADGRQIAGVGALLIALLGELGDDGDGA